MLGENGAWAYPGTAQIFWVPPIISGTGKATNFNFCTHILGIDRNKSLLQISEKVAGCSVRTLKTFQGTHILGASRGLLCDSSAVLLQCFLLYEIYHWSGMTTMTDLQLNHDCLMPLKHSRIYHPCSTMPIFPLRLGLYFMSCVFLFPLLHFQPQELSAIVLNSTGPQHSSSIAWLNCYCPLYDRLV